MSSLEKIHTIRQYLTEHFELSDDQLKELLPMFIRTIHDNVRELSEYAEQNDTTRISRMGHTLKGALLNLGLNELAMIARSVELYSFEERGPQECLQLIVLLKTRIYEIQPE